MGFNRQQLCTIEQARELVPQLAQYGMNVLPENADPHKSGIYLPDWVGGPLSFPIPHEGEDLKWFHLRFDNGAEGVNAGLVLDRLSRYPMSPGYVFRSLKTEVDAIAQSR